MYYLKDIVSDSILPIFPALILGSRYKKLSAPFKLLFYFLLISVALFSFSNYLADRMINNLFIYHLNTILNFIVLTFFLNENFLLFKNKLYSIVFTIVLVACILNILFIESIKEFDSNAVIFTNLLLIGLSIWALIKCLINQNLLENLKYYNLLITFGVFVYAASSIIVYSYFKYNNLFGIRTSNKVWFLYDNVMIFKYTCFIVAAFLWRKKV
jgi:hypothetical protein